MVLQLEMRKSSPSGSASGTTPHGVTVEQLLTDNACVYRVGSHWTAGCTALQIQRRFTEPVCPWTIGKAERLNRTLQTE